MAWYFQNFILPPDLAERHLELHFGAAFYSAKVWLNGMEIGSHEGGYTEFNLDLSGRLQGTFRDYLCTRT
jgi:beta-glucuronidase